jgi:hypothetical protein
MNKKEWKNIMTLKENGKERKRNRKYGRHIFCKECGEKIYIDSDEAKEFITKLANIRVYDCQCGCQILLDK